MDGLTQLVAPGSGAMTQAPRPITLALQGGGSLGAFAWGVLDRLLDEPQLRIEVVSGASAGAMNAAMVAQGLATGGPGEAKRLLEVFWRRVAVASGSPDTDWAGWLFPFDSLLSPMADRLRQHAAGLAQGQVNPLGLNPLRGVLDGLLNASVFGRDEAPTLVVAATRVRTGEARLFRDAEVTTEVPLASACLPQIFPAMEIDGELYWDGGFASNPPLRALIEAGAPPDVLLVRTTPLERPAAPVGSAAVADRISEVTFGATLRHELRSLALAQSLLKDMPAASGRLGRLRNARLHVIGAEEEFRALKKGSHMDPSWAFLRAMHGLGHEADERWLAENLPAVGLHATVDLSRFATPMLELSSRSLGTSGAL